MNLPEVTAEFLAAHERLATKILEAEEDASAHDVLTPGTQILCIRPTNILALINRVRWLEQEVANAKREQDQIRRSMASSFGGL